MSRIIVNKFYPGVLYSNAVFKSSQNSLLIMNRDGSIDMKLVGGKSQRYFMNFLGLGMPLSKIGMDTHGIVRVVTDMGINYPMHMDYRTIRFKPKDVYGILQDDMSFGVFDNRDRMVYEARFFPY